MSTTKKIQELFEPLMPTQMMKMWGGDGQERMENMVNEWEKWSQKGNAQAEEAVQESAKLMQATMEYSLELQKTMQAQAIEQSRKALEMFSGGDSDGE